MQFLSDTHDYELGISKKKKKISDVIYGKSVSIEISLPSQNGYGNQSQLFHCYC